MGLYTFRRGQVLGGGIASKLEKYHKLFRMLSEFSYVGNFER